MTSSIRPIRMPDRARARRADWAPGPGVLVPVPPVARILTWRAVIPICEVTRTSNVSKSGRQQKGEKEGGKRTHLLASLGALLGGKHGGVRGRLVSVGLDLHTTGDSRDGLLSRQIRHVNEGVVEAAPEQSRVWGVRFSPLLTSCAWLRDEKRRNVRSEDPGNSEDELALSDLGSEGGGNVLGGSNSLLGLEGVREKRSSGAVLQARPVDWKGGKNVQPF